MRRVVSFLAALLIGCGPVIDVEDDGAAEGEASGSAATEGSTESPPPDPGVDVPSPDPDPDPLPEEPELIAFFVDEGTSVTLTLSTYVGAACPDATPSFECASFVQWNADIVLPKPVAPGEYPIDALEGFLSETGVDRGGGDCSGGAGTLFGNGLLVIEVANDDVIEGLLVEADIVFDLDPISDMFTAPLCVP